MLKSYHRQEIVLPFIKQPETQYGKYFQVAFLLEKKLMIGIASIVLWFINVILLLYSVLYSLNPSTLLAIISLFFTSLACAFNNHREIAFYEPLLCVLLFIASIISTSFLGYSIYTIV